MNPLVAGIYRKLPAHLRLAMLVAGVYITVVIVSLGVDNETFRSSLVGAGIVVVAYTLLVAYVQFRYGERKAKPAEKE